MGICMNLRIDARLQDGGGRGQSPRDCGAANLAASWRRLAVGLQWVCVGLALALALALTGGSASAATPGAAAKQRLTVQLSWTHQTEFAGFYMAQRAGYFAQEGLDVVLLAGNAKENPIDPLQDGRSDVAISTLRGALARTDAARPVTNIAQIFQSSPIVLMCRPSLGVSAVQEVYGATVGVSGGGDVDVLRELLRVARPGGGDAKLVPRDGTGRVLIEGEAACITGVTFNELLRVQSAVPASDLVVLRPEAFGVADFGDGLYVRSDRLDSEAFRAQLVGLLRALAKGWRDARDHPALAVSATLEWNPALGTQFQVQALEQVLKLVPAQDFGLLRLDQVDAMSAAMAKGPAGGRVPSDAWTHRIWNEWQKADGNARGMTPSTRHALQGFAREPMFFWMVTVGTLMFGLGGAMLGIERGYNVWGRLLVAVLPAIGGGMIRDLIIGGPRLPFYFVADPTIPLALLLIVLAASLVVGVWPQLTKTQAFARTMACADMIGSAVIATNGAIVALIAGVPWVWVPVFAAISCAGGGLLLDIVTNHAPRAFRGISFEDEERGVLSGAVLLMALWVANQREDALPLVYAGALLAVSLNLLVRLKRGALARYYPDWLSAGPSARAPQERRHNATA